VSALGGKRTLAFPCRSHFLSDGMKQARGLNFLGKGTPVPAGTLTSDFIAKPGNVRLGQTDAGEGRLSDWFDGNDAYPVAEDVVGLGQYGRTLTVLTCKSLSVRPEDEPNEDDEVELIERWTPRFRR